MNQLESIFEELGISQYLDVFVEQGFDSWETILDITESDLDTLGVKLGHRRKLQRRIANHRGLAPVISLVSPTRASIEDNSTITKRPGPAPENKETTTVAKRKYRRHPKPDEKAPERPPSAYVLFSNRMREDLKNQNLSFTEIAKLVGENWQNLDRAEKAPYERQAQDAKENYNRNLNVYKKTDDYAEYCNYLQDFRKRQANQEKDTSKRIKIAESQRGSSSSAASTRPSRTTSGTGSSSESQTGSEPPPSRQQRLGSVTSQPEPYVSLSSDQQQLVDGTRRSPNEHGGRARGLSTPNVRDPSNCHSRRQSIMPQDGQRNPADSSGFGLPWLSGSSTGAPPTIYKSPESGLSSLTPTLSHASNSRAGSSSTPPWSGAPFLKTEQSSTGSTSSSINSSYPTPRTPSETSLPIHALLSSKPDGHYDTQTAPSPTSDTSMPFQPPLAIHQHPGRPPGLPSLESAKFLPPPGVVLGGLQAQKTPTMHQPIIAPDPRLDGMSALLRASDIVGRHDN